MLSLEVVVEPQLGRADWNRVLTEFDAAIQERSLPAIDVLIGGGGAMAYLFGTRATTDLDVLSDHLPEPYRRAAAEVGVTARIRVDWLNDAAKVFVPTLLRPAPARVVFQGEALVVSVPPPRYLLAMKLRASRESDLDDVHQLMDETGLHGAGELTDLLTSAYRRENLEPRMQYFAVEAASSFRAVRPGRSSRGESDLDFGL